MEDKKEPLPEQKEKQVAAQFSTKLPEKYQVPADLITLDTSMTTKELNSVFNVWSKNRS